MRRLLLLTVAAALLGAACGDDADTATEPGAAEPWGRTFVTDGPPPVRVMFRDGEVTAQAECNHLMGRASIDGDVLVVEQMGGTEMGCDPERHAYDEWLSTFLTSSPTMALDGATLTLTAGTDSLVLTDRVVADPDRPLVGTRWVLDGIVTGDVASSMPEGAGEVAITFTDGAVEADGLCNGLRADVAIADSSIEIADFAHTEMSCGAAADQIDTAVYAAIQGSVAYEIEATTLRLTGPDRRGLTLRAAE